LTDEPLTRGGSAGVRETWRSPAWCTRGGCCCYCCCRARLAAAAELTTATACLCLSAAVSARARVALEADAGAGSIATPRLRSGYRARRGRTPSGLDAAAALQLVLLLGAAPACSMAVAAHGLCCFVGARIGPSKPPPTTTPLLPTPVVDDEGDGGRQRGSGAFPSAVAGFSLRRVGSGGGKHVVSARPWCCR
jgi:hypothetical protein